MSVTPTSYNGWRPEGAQTQLPPGGVVPMQASQQAGRGQAVYFDASGNCALNDGASPGLVCAGIIFEPKITTLSTNAGAASTSLWEGYGSGIASSTIANDAFLATDYGVIAYDAGNGTPGKLSNYSGSNRSIMGIVFGLADDGTPRLWCGTAAQIAARSLMVSNTVLLGQHNYLVDAGAGTDLTEIQFSEARAKLHGMITSIEYVPNATLAATGGTDFKTLTVTKYDSAGANPVVVGTMTTTLVQTKWVAKAFTLSAVAHALEVLEGDQFTIQNSHGGSGAVTPAGVIRINGKAI